LTVSWYCLPFSRWKVGAADAVQTVAGAPPAPVVEMTTVVPAAPVPGPTPDPAAPVPVPEAGPPDPAALPVVAPPVAAPGGPWMDPVQAARRPLSARGTTMLEGAERRP
jgi:hypothetical protein